ncbi:hypothetical protein M2352_003379 [Azospirillum fermentarium]|uniref:peptidoglycan-binding domain-containing protein n=1 Tax=Azospirillum fermentarium TaxID=1233114 RepID=UPI002225E96A|nr:hypothetical protein [Azospirillum fermentarium]MCW2247745.1 hypothetical protein [Azospirillum fermentarium]
MFDLLQNPFAILGVSPRDGADVLTDHYEDALIEHGIDEKALLKAHQALAASKPRLEAELSWLLGVTPGRLARIVAMLRKGDCAGAAETLSGLPPLARMNLAAHLCGHGFADSYHINCVLNAKADVHSHLVATLINSERQVAGIKPISEELVETGLRALERGHVETILAAVTAIPNPGATITNVVSIFIDAPAQARDMLECIVDGFDRWTAPRLHAINEKVDTQIERLHNEPFDERPLDVIKDLLADWNSLTQAQQLVYQAKHLDEPRSEELYQKIRKLAVWLSNEHDLYAMSLRLIRALEQTFTRLHSVHEQLPEDIQTLERMLATTKEVTLPGPLRLAIETAMEDPLAFIRAVQSGALSGHSGGRAGAVWAAFENAVLECLGTESEDAPWLAMRQLAIQLNNDHNAAAAAQRIMTMLLAHQPPPPDRLRPRLADDHLSLERSVLREDLNHAIERKDDQRVLSLTERLLELGGDDEEREKLLKLRATVQEKLKRNRRGLWRLAIGAGVVAVSLFVRNVHAPNPGAPNPSAPSPSVASFQPTERKPAQNGTYVSLEELRYCMYQNKRLDGAQPAADTEARKGRFNELVADFNALCSKYTYSMTDMAVVKSELRIYQTSLLEEGAVMMRAVSGGTLPAQRTDVRPAAQPKGPLESGSVALALFRREDASRVQSRLAELSLYNRSVDGVWGPGSQSALDAFIAGQGLPKGTAWSIDVQKRLFSGTGR